MGSSEKRSKDVVMSDIPTFSAENLQKNLKVIQNRSVSQFSITHKLSFSFSQKDNDHSFLFFFYHVVVSLFCSRTFLSIIAGVLAVIIGFTSLTGFVFYFVVMLITSVGLIAKAGFSADLYFDSWNRVLFDGFLGGLMVFAIISFYCIFSVYVVLSNLFKAQTNHVNVHSFMCLCGFY
ncbi:hypothetical protein HA466_0101100 [Hirschfeldia incana]|nr:hypothetical protein HA466_0101100 [Hirschfeldia incana]